MPDFTFESDLVTECHVRMINFAGEFKLRVQKMFCYGT